LGVSGCAVSWRIVDLTWRDTSADYNEAAPTWVAGALVELRPVSGRGGAQTR